MQPVTVLMVVLSAAAHAVWNYLLKRQGGGQVFVGLSKVAEAAILAPVLGLWVWWGPGDLFGRWWFPVVGAALVLINYAALAAAYRRADLSLVYPMSRGGTLLCLPPLAFLAFGERPDAAGWLAIGAVVVGIVCLQLPSLGPSSWLLLGRSLRGAATLFAALAAAVAAGYTVWDKMAVQVLAPFVYFAAYTALVGLVYGLYLLVSVGAPSLRTAWRAQRAPILQVAALNSLSYLLLLAALRGGSASYVIALRQLSIVGAALLGAAFLGESLPLPRRVGIGLVVGGCILLAVG